MRVQPLNSAADVFSLSIVRSNANYFAAYFVLRVDHGDNGIAISMRLFKKWGGCLNQVELKIAHRKKCVWDNMLLVVLRSYLDQYRRINHFYR